MNNSTIRAILSLVKIKHLKTLTKAEYFHGGALPCIVRVMKAAPSNDTVALHGHEFSELVLVASGSLKHLHRKRTDVLNPGDFLIVHPGMRHGYAELANGTTVYNLIFTDSLREYTHLLATNPLLRFIFPQDDDSRTSANVLGTVDATTVQRTVRLMDEIRAEEKSPTDTSAACCGALFAATVALLARGIRDTASQHREQDSLHAELAFINDHLGEKISVRRLCEISGRSPSTLTRLFLAAYGKSPIDYLIERRLDQAEILCSATDDTLTQIALRCGFADPSHLLRTFHRHGRTPPQRKKG